MGKIKSKVYDISSQHCVETDTEAMAKTGFKAVRKTIPLALELIGSILIFLFVGIVGCSDMPYTGSMLPVDDIDRYLISVDGDTYCLQNGYDSTCLTLTPRRQGTNAPVIHIYPSKLIYVFYHEGKEIVRAEKAMDTSEIVKELIDTGTTGGDQGTRGIQDDGGNNGGKNGGNNDGNNGGNNGDNNGDSNDPVPTTQESVSGDGQSAEINQQLANALIVRVLDQNGDPLSGVTVNFSVSPSGTLNPASATTDTNGEASTELTLGSTAGSYTVTASVSGIGQQVTFTATATDNSGGNNPGTNIPPGINNPVTNSGDNPNNGGLSGNSHLYYTQNSPITIHGWLVTIYYPVNYKGPRNSRLGFSGCGFNITDLTNGAAIINFAQTNGTCYPGDEANMPCHPDDDDDDEWLELYSAQFRVKKEQVVEDGGSTVAVLVSFTVVWDQSAANWNGTPPSDTTYTLDSNKNMEGYDPDHTSQGN